MWYNKLKEAGVNIHIVATGAGAGIQQELWKIPGSSAYLSGASFPYAQEEQEELLGFMPEHFCSEEAAIDLASAAYMKAYKFGGKSPVGLGLTASVASEKEHRGEHRYFACIMTTNQVLLVGNTLEKGVGLEKRLEDGQECDDDAVVLLLETLKIIAHNPGLSHLHSLSVKDVSIQAMERLFKRPFFTAGGKRYQALTNSKSYALMSGAFNPPHEGHFGLSDQVQDEYGKKVVFEITALPPHKEALMVQDLLQRAKLLQGYDRLFTQSYPMYLDKAKAFPGIPLVMGADAMLRLLDPKWGVDIDTTLNTFAKLKTDLYISGRLIGDKFITANDILTSLTHEQSNKHFNMIKPIYGRWDISSTQLRIKV